MAASRSDVELAEQGAFVQALYELGGYARWTEFAADARVQATQLSDWQRGAAGMDGYNLLKLIRAAATRSLRAPTQTASEAARVSEPLTAKHLDARLEELSGAMTDATESLSEQISALQHLLGQQPAQPPHADVQSPPAAADQTQDG